MFVLILIILCSAPICTPVRAAEWTDDEIERMAQNAEETVRKAFDALWDLRLKVDLADTVRDPDMTGVIGIKYSPLTTTLGYQDSKELSAKPGWAAWLVKDLAARGIWQRADIAVSFSGSFPGLNIAVLAALQEFDADVRGIASIGASSYGANEPGLSYPEMERFLREEGILKTGSSAVTLGGTSDKGAEFSDYALDLAMESVKNSRLPLLKPLNLKDAVKKRMRFYGLPKDYACYINVGGGHASMGGSSDIRYQRGGWYFDPPKIHGQPDGVMDRFLEDGVPCLNLLYLEKLHAKYEIVNF